MVAVVLHVTDSAAHYQIIIRDRQRKRHLGQHSITAVRNVSKKIMDIAMQYAFRRLFFHLNKKETKNYSNKVRFTKTAFEFLPLVHDLA